MSAVASLEIHVRKAKNDQKGRGYRRKHTRSGDKNICIVEAYLRHCQMIYPHIYHEAPITALPEGGLDNEGADHVEDEEWEGPADSGAYPCITRADVSKSLKRAARSLGELRDDYASHSLRIGGATAMRAAGYSDSFVQWFGNWKSLSYRSYMANTVEELESGVAERMCQVDAMVYER